MAYNRLPRIYLAGKIAKNGWREKITGYRNGGEGVDADEALSPLHEVEFGNFILTGPHFIACDHGCAHGGSKHGAGLNFCTEDKTGDTQPTRRDRIHSLSLQRIKSAWCIFAYINEVDCFGTLAEIGYAHAKGKAIYLCFGENLTPSQRRDLWFIERFATAVLLGPVEQAFEEALELWEAEQNSLTRRALALQDDLRSHLLCLRGDDPILPAAMVLLDLHELVNTFEYVVREDGLDRNAETLARVLVSYLRSKDLRSIANAKTMKLAESFEALAASHYKTPKKKMLAPPGYAGQLF